VPAVLKTIPYDPGLAERRPDLAVGMPRFPERWPEMGIGWASRGQAAELHTSPGAPGYRGEPADRDQTRRLGWPGDLRTANAVYQPVELAGASVDSLASQALALHQHAIAIWIGIGYYPNLNPAAPEYRPRKRLLPVWGSPTP
jgi:hypothetical protein